MMTYPGLIFEEKVLFYTLDLKNLPDAQKGTSLRQFYTINQVPRLRDQYITTD